MPLRARSVNMPFLYHSILAVWLSHGCPFALYVNLLPARLLNPGVLAVCVVVSACSTVPRAAPPLQTPSALHAPPRRLATPSLGSSRTTFTMSPQSPLSVPTHQLTALQSTARPLTAPGKSQLLRFGIHAFMCFMQPTQPHQSRLQLSVLPNGVVTTLWRPHCSHCTVLAKHTRCAV